MPTIEHTGGPGRFAHTALDHVSGHGDRHEVSESAAVHLCDDVGYFARIDEPDGQEQDPIEGKPVAEVNASEHLDRWLDQHYTHRAEQVRSGDVDGSLDVVEEAETSDTVIEAVDARRDELEG